MTSNKKFPWLTPTLSVICCVSLGFSQINPATEIASRSTDATSAYELLKAGDVAYEKGSYADAVKSFKEAINIVPLGTRTKTLRIELAERYATAAAQEAKLLTARGRHKEARSLLEEALLAAPNNAFAKTQLEYLDDPIRNNPSLTAEHVDNIDKVRRLLYKAEGAYNLGKYDESTELYNDVLKIDKYNKAARRGLERVEAIKSEYYTSAYDHTRAKLLGEIDAEWEIDTIVDPSLTENPSLLDLNTGADRVTSNLEQKLDTIVLPNVDMTDVNISEAIDILRFLSAENDTIALTEDSKGVQFINRVEGELGEKRFNLNLKNVPIRKVIESMTSLLGLDYIPDGYTVSIVPFGSDGESLTVRTYTVPLNFLSTPISNTQTLSNDPFDPEPTSGSTVGGRVSALTILESFGVKFENGATASYLPSLNKLVVKNTYREHTLIADVVEQLSNDQPLMVTLELAIIRVGQINTDEQGVDVSIEGTIADALGDLGISGGSVGNQSPNGDQNGNPLTAGNRSGNQVSDSPSIDALIGAGVDAPAGELLVSDVVASANSGGTVIIDQLTIDATEATTIESTPAPGAFGIVGSADEYTIETLFRGLKQKAGTDMLLRPSVVAQSGQQARVFVGTEFIYPTSYDPPQIFRDTGSRTDLDFDDLDNDFGFVIITDNIDFFLLFDDALNLVEVFIDGQTFSDDVSGAGTPATPEDFETTNLGTELSVIPTVSADNQVVDLGVVANFREFQGFINYGTPLTGSVSNVSLLEDIDEAELFSAGLFFDVSVFDIANFDDDDFDADDFGTLVVGFDGVEIEADELFGDIIQTTNRFIVTDNQILMPIFESINIDTNVSIYDGATLILGGLIESNPTIVQDQTPILGSIPIIGNLFKSEVENTVKSHLLLTISARVIDSRGRPLRSVQ